MTSNDFLADIQSKWQNQMNEDFKSQNSELLDVIFEIEGKKLYAHKQRLSIVSTTFKSMLSERWNSTNDAIKINGYGYEDFKEFLTFVYSGECNLCDQNILAMIDLAEFYHVDYLKELCDKYLSDLECTTENIIQLMEISNKYSMIQIKESIQNYISKNFTEFVKSNNFLQADKCIVEELVAMQSKIFVLSEDLFQAVYEWSEYQAKQKQLSSIEDNFNLNDAIKADVTPFLSSFEFKEMNMNFLHTFVVQRGFIFSYDELSNILKNASPPEVNVKVTNSHGQSITGTLPYCSNAIEVIKSLRNLPSKKFKYGYVFWDTKCKVPSTPNPLKKRVGVQWYFFYFNDDDVGVKPCNLLTEKNYLLSEMVANEEFSLTDNCKIEIE